MKLKLEWCFLFSQAFLIILCLSFCSNQKINASVVPEYSYLKVVKEIKLNITKVSSTKWSCWSNPREIEVDRRFLIRVRHVSPNNTGEILLNRIGRCNWWPWQPTIDQPTRPSYTSVIFTKDHSMSGLVSNVFDVSTRSGTWFYECIFYLENAVCDYYNGHKCIATTSSGRNATDHGVSCETKIRIPNNNRSRTQVGHLTANNKHFYPDPKSQDYRFYDGEGTNFTCHETTDDHGHVKLKYYKKGVLYITNQETGSVSMYMKLTADNDGDSLECVYYHQHHFITQVIKLNLTVDKNAASSMWGAILAGVLGLGSGIAVTIIIVRRCRGRPGGGGPGAGAGPASPPGDSPAAAEVNHEYENIDCPIYDVPYADFAPVAPAPDASRDISDRDACPVPEHPEDAKYIHYATPYEFRIFRPGFPAQ